MFIKLTTTSGTPLIVQADEIRDYLPMNNGSFIIFKNGQLVAVLENNEHIFAILTHRLEQEC